MKRGLMILGGLVIFVDELSHVGRAVVGRAVVGRRPTTEGGG